MALQKLFGNHSVTINPYLFTETYRLHQKPMIIGQIIERGNHR